MHFIQQTFSTSQNNQTPSIYTFLRRIYPDNNLLLRQSTSNPNHQFVLLNSNHANCPITPHRSCSPYYLSDCPSPSFVRPQSTSHLDRIVLLDFFASAPHAASFHNLVAHSITLARRQRRRVEEEDQFILSSRHARPICPYSSPPRIHSQLSVRKKRFLHPTNEFSSSFVCRF